MIILTKTELISEFIKTYHKGRENAVKSKELERIFNIDGRSVRRFIHTMRKKGVPICSDSSVGYFYATTQDEINETIAFLNGIITKMSNAKSGLLNASLLERAIVNIEINVEINC